MHGETVKFTFIYHFLRRHPKSILCATEVDDIRDLQKRMKNGVEIFRTTPGIFQLVRQSLFTRVHPRVAAPGRRCFFTCRETVVRFGRARSV